MFKSSKARSANVFLAFVFMWFSSIASADVSGTWTFTVDIAGMGSGTPTVVMVQDAEGGITGTYSGQLGNAPITGKAAGSDFEFVISSDAGSVTYKGAVKEDGSVAGTLDLGGMASGTFTGKKSG